MEVHNLYRDEDMKEQLLSFSVVFSIDSAFFSLVQACWFIDHEKFEVSETMGTKTKIRGLWG